MSFHPHTRVGRYVIDSLLGAGGMGEVYKAYDEGLRRPVALKFLFAQPGERDRSSRLHREARAAAGLDHPFICKVYEVGDIGDDTFIAMEYVAGQTMAARLAAGPVPFSLALRLAIEVADALGAAHRRSIIHRDLKPSNIMIADDGHVKVLDFGLASPGEGGSNEATAPTTQSTTGGTLAYMAPEQLRAEPADARSDVFAFGIVLAELFTGVHPFARNSNIETASAILTDEPRPWPDTSTVPALVRHIIRKALAKAAAERYSSAQDLLVDLRAVESNGNRDQPMPLRDRARAHRVRRGVLAVAMMAVALLGVFAWRWTRAPAEGELAELGFVQVTTSGNVIAAALSPDGQSVAYVAEDGGNRRLLIRDLSGGPSLQLAESPFLDAPQWLPDGTRLQYQDQKGILEIARLGGTTRKGFPFRPASWSADGTRIAVMSSSKPLVLLFTADGRRLSGPTEIVGAQRLHGIDWNRASPRLLLFGIDVQNRGTIWTTTPEAKDVRVVHVEDGPITAVRWSPLTSIIYFLRTRAETVDLVSIDADNPGAPRVLATGLPTGGGLTVSTDGQKILHMRASTRANLAIIDVARPADRPRPITNGTGYLSEADVSPDAGWVVAVSGSGAKTSIVKIAMKGGDPIRLTDGNARDRSPAWSPDGRQIAFGSNRGGENGIWVMDDDGRNSRKLDQATGSELLAVAWAPDGRVMWQRETPEKWFNYQIRSLETGEEEYLARADSQGFAFRPRFSPRADRIALHWARVPSTRTGLWLLGWPSRSERQLAEFLWPLGWSKDGEFIYAIADADSTDLSPGIWRVSATSGESRLWATLPGGRVLDGVVGPDQSSIIVSVRESTGDAWLINAGERRPALANPVR